MLQFIVKPKRGIVIFIVWMFIALILASIAWLQIMDFGVYFALIVIPNAVAVVVTLFVRDVIWITQKDKLIAEYQERGFSYGASHYLAMHCENIKPHDIQAVKDYWI